MQLSEYAPRIDTIKSFYAFLSVSIRVNPRSSVVIKEFNHEEKLTKKRSFYRVILYKLHTPLNVMIGFTGILRDEFIGTVTAEQKECPGDIHSGNHTCLTATWGYATTFYDVQVIEYGNLLKSIIQVLLQSWYST